MLKTFKQRLRDALGIRPIGIGSKKKTKKESIMNACDSAARSFLQEFGNVPGVLKVERDGFFSDTILVFIDKKKLPKASLPPQHEGFDVSLYDVRYILSTSKIFLKLVQAEGVDLTVPENKSTYEHFVRTVGLCKEMLG